MQAELRIAMLMMEDALQTGRQVLGNHQQGKVHHQTTRDLLLKPRLGLDLELSAACCGVQAQVGELLLVAREVATPNLAWTDRCIPRHPRQVGTGFTDLLRHFGVPLYRAALQLRIRQPHRQQPENREKELDSHRHVPGFDRLAEDARVLGHLQRGLRPLLVGVEEASHPQSTESLRGKEPKQVHSAALETAESARRLALIKARSALGHPPQSCLASQARGLLNRLG
mmetsp:Transcript_59745/g.142156  ORF Transcript_59745/g.142156 Transcript_59745/m.142156 type:complete len:227 (+) Transcript_59745:1400-2080(+)